MSDALTRLSAALEGRYRIERQLGEGGMATVYLAEDLKHRRKVALKVLKPELAAVVGAERFLAEIETTANLQHPHILPLFDSGEVDGFLFYVMPWVEGESLRDRLDREHQLPVDEALRIATSVAQALDYAHRRGVIHRDIKPANILLHDGQPVVSDFGIALAVSAGGAGRLTETGLSLGTPHYMSPEQATGDQSVGPATDIYALGCVLYEMLVGEPPYTGSTPQAILGRIIAGEAPSASASRKLVPPHVDAVIRKALEKVPADRFTSAQELARSLAQNSFRHGATTATGGRRSAEPSATDAGAWRVPAAIAIAAVMTVVAAVGWLRPAPPAGLTEVARFQIPIPDSLPLDLGGNSADLAISPDGRLVLYQTRYGGSGSQFQLVLRSLDQVETTILRGGEGAVAPFVSDDGQQIGFLDSGGNTLRVAPAGGGPPVVLARVPTARGAEWLPDGRIVLGTQSSGLYEIPSGGGEPRALTALREGEGSHGMPHVISGRNAVVFVITPPAGSAAVDGQLAVLDMESGEIIGLGLAGSSPRYARSGHLVYSTGDGSLRGVGFDAGSLNVMGTPVPLLERVATKASGSANYAISDNGTLVYQEALGESVGLQRLAIQGMDGRMEVLPLSSRPIEEPGPSWSPDGRTVAFSSAGNIYTYDVVLNTAPRQITFAGNNGGPVFSPDGRRLAFTSNGLSGTDAGDIFVKDLGDDSPPRLVIAAAGRQRVDDWPFDTLLAVSTLYADSSSDLRLLDISDPEAPEARLYLSSEADLHDFSLAPDGTLAAYTSNESGKPEVYLRSFPSAGPQIPVSLGGAGIATVPRWAPDGSTLYYTTGRYGPVIAARLRRDARPVVLSLDTIFDGSGWARPAVRSMHPDGDRFIATVGAGATGSDEGGPATQQLIVVLNFFDVLKERLGGDR